MSKEHLGIALALNVPVMVIITKIDICPPNILKETISQVNKIMKSPGARKMPTFITNREECVNTATQFVSKRICPVFQVSNVTGENLDLVRLFLNMLPHHGHYHSDAPFEFQVNDTFSVPFTGTVVSGIVKSGMVHEGDNVLIGPDSLGHFTPTAVRSIERKRIRVQVAEAGQSASFALKKMKRRDVRKGMVMLHKEEGQTGPKVFQEFVAEGESFFDMLLVQILYGWPANQRDQFSSCRTQPPSRSAIRQCCMSVPYRRHAPSSTLTAN
jgi:GTPase